MAAGKKKRTWKDVLFLAFYGITILVGTRFFLERYTAAGDPHPVAYDARVHEEPNDFVADVRAARQLIEQRFSYLELRSQHHGLDLDAAEATALRELGDAPDRAAFEAALKRFVAKLKDGHSYVRFKDAGLPSNRHWPFTVLEVAEGVMIDGVHPDAANVLQRGDLIRRANGRPIDALIADAALETLASTDGARRRVALQWIANWSSETELELVLEGLDGSERTVRVECPLRRLTIETPGALPTERAEEMLDGNIAYFRPGDFSAPADSGFIEATPEERQRILAESWAEIARTFERSASARGFILDLRGNPGGTDLLGQYLVSHLLPGKFTYFQLSALRKGGWRDPSSHSSSAPKAERHLVVPLVCLIDERTFSVADNVAACLHDLHPDVTFIGRNTGAGTGAPRSFPLPRTGTEITFCTQRVYAPNGGLIEGTGVAPDVYVMRSRADVLAGKDTALEKALELLSE